MRIKPISWKPILDTNYQVQTNWRTKPITGKKPSGQNLSAVQNLLADKTFSGQNLSAGPKLHSAQQIGAHQSEKVK